MSIILTSRRSCHAPVERENQTLQCGRLQCLFKNKGITTIEEANAFFESNGLYDMYRKWFPFGKDDPQNRLRNRKSKFARKDDGHDKNENTAVFVKADMSVINSVLVVKYPHKTDRGGMLSHKSASLLCDHRSKFLSMGYHFLCPTLPDRNVIVCMNEKEGIWATPIFLVTMGQNGQFLSTMRSTAFWDPCE